MKDGLEERLEISGVGYRAAMQGKNLQLSLGFSHEVIYQVPEGITVAVPKPTEIVVTGIDKQQVGQVAAEIREYRSPEPYKGKGVKYAGEKIVRAKKVRRSKEFVSWHRRKKSFSVALRVFAANSRRLPVTVRGSASTVLQRISTRRSSMMRVDTRLHPHPLSKLTSRES